MVCLTKIHTATRYLDERRTAYDERSSLKRRDDDVAQGYAAYDGQCRYDEGCDEDQGIVLENRHGLEDIRKDVNLAIEEDMLDQGPHEDHDDDGHDMDQALLAAITIAFVREEIKREGGDDEDTHADEAETHDGHDADDQALRHRRVTDSRKEEHTQDSTRQRQAVDDRVQELGIPVFPAALQPEIDGPGSQVLGTDGQKHPQGE